MDQLRRQSFDLTISTFMAEMTAKAKCNKADFGLGFDSFQKNDVLDILGLDRSDISFETGALCELINLIIDRRISKHDQVQTVDERPKSFAINQPIYDKLQNLGHVLNAVNETELEDLKDEGRPFKRMELIYVDKLKQLQDRENSLLDGMDKERKALEELSYQQRESILREIDSVKLREQESRLRLEERQSDLKVFEERLEKQFRELKVSDFFRISFKQTRSTGLASIPMPAKPHPLHSITLSQAFQAPFYELTILAKEGAGGVPVKEPEANRFQSMRKI